MNPTLRSLVVEMGGRVLLEVPGRVGFELDGLRYVVSAKGDRVFLSGRENGRAKSVEVASLEAISAAVSS